MTGRRLPVRRIRPVRYGGLYLEWEIAHSDYEGNPFDVILRSSDRRRYVLYQEEASSIEVDVSGTDGTRPAVAVNTVVPDEEIDLGDLEPYTTSPELW